MKKNLKGYRIITTRDGYTFILNPSAVERLKGLRKTNRVI